MAPPRDPTAAQDGPVTDRRTWLGLGVLLLPVLLISMDVGVLYYAVPFIDRDLAPSSAAQLWIMDAYGFVLAGLLVTMGAVGDRIGRRRLLMFGAAAFGGASVLAALAPTAGALIGARGLLGVAGATLMPSTLGLIRAMFENARDRRTAIAWWTAGSAGGVAVGPVFGGVVLEHLHWGAVFLVNVPAALLILVLAPRLLPEHRAARAAPFDLVGAVLSLLAVLTAVFALKRAAVDGLDAPAVGAAAAGAVLLGLFVRRERSAARPLLDLRLFRVRAFGVANAVNVAAMLAIAGSGLFTTQYLQLVRGLSPLASALYGLPPTACVMVAATLATVSARAVPPAWILAAGLVVGAAGFLVLTAVEPRSGPALVLVGASAVAGGAGAVLPIAADTVLGAAPADQAGAVSAISETSSELGGAIGIALLGSVGAAVYRRATEASLPVDAPQSARETLAGAVSSADGMRDAAAGLRVLDAARDAFTQGLHAAGLVGAGVLLVAAIGTIAALRGTEVPGDGGAVRSAEHAVPSPGS